MSLCGVCGSTSTCEAVYKARDDHDKTLVGLPGIECQGCGALRPDVEKIETMPDEHVPSSVRIRCAKIRAYGVEASASSASSSSARRGPV
jgi:hypothetical protein